MSLQGQLVRCPNCVHALNGEQPGSGELLLDPERNLCPLCGHVFSAAQALIETYTGHGGYGSARAHHPERQSRGRGQRSTRSTKREVRPPRPGPETGRGSTQRLFQ